ncbi:hypothetical protein GOODEAATRI_020399 [Goodea atripinnis]|uniref:UDP-N-acetylhexosamine pyrophosphorylase-like protein 1 n=1 Tax=Goodea atripinnis TaxID=208336 RepID=A0ABV0NW79_9TELE
MPSLQQIRTALDGSGQAHVLRFWPELSEEEKEVFLQELGQLDLQRLKEHCQAAAETAKAATSSCLDRDLNLNLNLEPVPPESMGSVTRSDPENLAEWEHEGTDQNQNLVQTSCRITEISRNRVAVLLLAGGQGTRLGVQYPKGMYNVGLPSGKTLYQIQAERILKIQELAESRCGSKCTVPWYIMTSEFTLKPTQTFFQENSHFGLEPSNIILFEQRMIPAVTFDGNVILERKGKIAMAPDEPVGVVCRVGGVPQVVEYSEIRPEIAQLRGPAGELVHSAGNICNHFFTRSFLHDVAE